MSLPLTIFRRETLVTVRLRVLAGALGLRDHCCGRCDQPQCHRLKVLDDSCEMELVAGTREASQPHALEAVMGFQVRKAHLDTFPLIT